MGSGELLFEPPQDAKFPFFIKSVKAVLKAYEEDDSTAFSGLKEYKPMGVVAPSSLTLLPKVSKMSEMFREGKLKAYSPSFQLRDF